MPRAARVAPGGCVYHVLNRAVARLPLFRKEADYAAFERLLLEAQERHLSDRLPIRGAKRPDGQGSAAGPGVALGESVGPARGWPRTEGPAVRLAGGSAAELGGAGQCPAVAEGGGVRTAVHCSRPAVGRRGLAAADSGSAGPDAHAPPGRPTQEEAGWSRELHDMRKTSYVPVATLLGILMKAR